MATVKAGDTVKVHYSGKLEDGTVFDSSFDREPLEFKVGEGNIIPGFEEAVIGMAVEEEKVVKIPPDKAYGEHDESRLLVVPKSQMPPDAEPKVGDKLQMSDPKGMTFIVDIIKVTEEEVTLDTNHPLAGKELTFVIKIVEIS